MRLSSKEKLGMICPARCGTGEGPDLELPQNTMPIPEMSGQEMAMRAIEKLGMICPACCGTGEEPDLELPQNTIPIPDGWWRCERCGGTGTLPPNRDGNK